MRRKFACGTVRFIVGLCHSCIQPLLTSTCMCKAFVCGVDLMKSVRGLSAFHSPAGTH